jgi:hypothetical protein
MATAIRTEEEPRKYDLLIGGQEVVAGGGARDSIDPATGRPWASVG